VERAVDETVLLVGVIGPRLGWSRRGPGSGPASRGLDLWALGASSASARRSVSRRSRVWSLTT